MAINFEIPKDCSQITLGEYLKWGNSDDPIHTVRTFSNLSEDDIRLIPKLDIDYLADEIAKALDSQLATLQPIIKLNGREYGFEPNMDDMATGAYLDLEAADSDNDILKRMCVLYRPVIKRWGSKYDVLKYDANMLEDNAEDMKEMTLDQVNGVHVFFSTLGKELLNSSKYYLMEVARRKIEEAKELTTSKG